MNTACEQYADYLIDFVDGEVSSKMQQELAGHLASCQECRKQVVLLRQSMAIAGELWRGRAAAIEPADIRPASIISCSGRNTGKHAWQAPAMIAMAALLLIALGLSPRLPSAGEEDAPQVAANHQQASDPQHSIPQRSIPQHSIPQPNAPHQRTMAEITLILQQEETSARMAKAAEIIRNEPSGEAFALLTRKHIARWFPNTMAGRAAIDELRNGEHSQREQSQEEHTQEYEENYQ